MEQNESSPTPRSIETAVRVLYVSATLALVLTLVTWLNWITLPFDGQGSITGFLIAALLAFTSNRIRSRRNWARWMFAVLFVLGTLLGIVVTALAPDLWTLHTPATLLSTIIQTVIQTIALFLVFTPAANAWFRT
jgi:multisubunit Na+/H+ antiporter MnhE subunit